MPQSRKAGFSKTGLAAAVASADIEYLHVRALGTPKEGRIAARHGDLATLSRVYADHLEGDAAQGALVALGKESRLQPTCLLCVERDHRAGHRAIVAERVVAATGLAAVHLLPGLPAG